ncbi:hypothetical protein NDU88_006064 [Pleurodeles waltl]|uniref:Uncharacterized protein n=1 Tax=Pleurodeles waltl TaxID=8319 RepID=A0AAV7SNR9_PLEWA|nr:hypothetical protein NDU88_006064 [Pleurodeles waltl]
MPPRFLVGTSPPFQEEVRVQFPPTRPRRATTPVVRFTGGWDTRWSPLLFHRGDPMAPSSLCLTCADSPTQLQWAQGSHLVPFQEDQSYCLGHVLLVAPLLLRAQGDPQLQSNTGPALLSLCQVGPGVVPSHKSLAWAPLTLPPPDVGEGGLHQASHSSTGFPRCPSPAAVFRRGPPLSRSRGPPASICSSRGRFPCAALSAPNRAPGSLSRIPGVAATPRRIRLLRSWSILRRLPPPPPLSAAQVCCGGGSWAGLHSIGEIKAPPELSDYASDI